MLRLPRFGRDIRVNALICSGHFLSHSYQLCLPPMFIVWQQAFGVSYAELGLSMALMSGTTAVVQTPIGFLVDRYGARGVFWCIAQHAWPDPRSRVLGIDR